MSGLAWHRVEIAREWTGALLILVAVVSVVMAAYLLLAARRPDRDDLRGIPRALLYAQGTYKLVTVASVYAVLALLVLYDDDATPLWGFLVVAAAAGAAVWLFREWVRLTHRRKGGTTDAERNDRA
jgi:cobalamin synthase